MEPNISDFQKFADELTRADHETFDVCEVLRGERSAVEAYGQVMRDFQEGALDLHRTEILGEVMRDHMDAVVFWEHFLRGRHAPVNLSSGPWGKVVEAFIGAAKIFGETALLRALKEGEEHGLAEYKGLLERPHISAESRDHIVDVLIPGQMRHISILTAMTDVH